MQAAAAAALLLALRGCAAAAPYCKPGNACWPTSADVQALRRDVTGEVLTPTDPEYHEAKKMIGSGKFSAIRPGFIVQVRNEDDVRAALSFAKNHTMRICVKSTGHDYDGRSTAPDSVMINVRKLKSKVPDLAAQTITVGTGNSWGEVARYLKINHPKFEVCTGAISTVGVTGWMLGGGHGELGRAHGLGVDQVVSLRIVVADGRYIVVSAAENADLFWALRGGGGGSWGVILEITYKIHEVAPTCMLSQVFTLRKVGAARVFQKFLAAAPDEVGGGEFLPTAAALVTSTRYRGKVGQSVREVHGEAKKALKPLTDFEPGAIECQSGARSSVPGVIDCGSPACATYTVSNFLDNDSLLVKDALVKITQNPHGSCFGQWIGGAASRVDNNATAVHPGFRTGKMAMTCAGVGTGAGMDHWANTVFNALGDGGNYVNEPQHNLVNWKAGFWTEDKYTRLLQIKRKWDPEFLFLVHHGVGWEETPGPNSA